MEKIIFPILISWMLLAGCQPSKITTGVLEVRDAWARPAVTGDNGAVYLVLANGTPQADTLLSAKTEVASVVELHLSQMEGDHMSMHHQEEIVIPVGEAVEFSQGGLHIMLVGLTRDLVNGETFDITLLFEHAGEQGVTVTVKDAVNDD